MAVNYLQYIRSVQPGGWSGSPELRFLVSGADPQVRRVIGEAILSDCRTRSKTLYLVDYTQGAVGAGGRLGDLPIRDALDSPVRLCSDLLEVDTVPQISRLRSLLASLGFDGTRSMKVVTYLSFVRETERRLGNRGTLTTQVLEEYSSVKAVTWKLERLASVRGISEETHEYLLGKYAEISGAAADFEPFLLLLAPFLEGEAPSPGEVIRLSVGRFSADPPMQALMCALLLSCLRQSPESSTVLILDNGRGDRCALLDLLQSLPTAVQVHLLSQDVFSLKDGAQNLLMNTFSVRIYTRHEDMSSCGRIEDLCGQIDVVKRASTVTVDRRLRANSPWDLLFGTNRTETESQNAPTKEARFRKEWIHTLPPSTGILDCGGIPVLFPFGPEASKRRSFT